MEYVVSQADVTSENLRNVSGYLAAAKQTNIDQIPMGQNVQSDIDDIQTKIDSAAGTLSSKTQDNSEKIKDLIRSVYVNYHLNSYFPVRLFGRNKIADFFGLLQESGSYCTLCCYAPFNIPWIRYAFFRYLKLYILLRILSF